jgi:hypothetical protein
MSSTPHLWSCSTAWTIAPPRELFEDPIRFPNVERTPHIVLEHNGTYWTSVVLFFRKPTRYDWPGLMGRAVAGRLRRVLASRS